MCTKSGGGDGYSTGSMGIPNSRGQWGGNWRPFSALGAWFRGQASWSPFRPSTHPTSCRWRRFCQALGLAT